MKKLTSFIAIVLALSTLTGFGQDTIQLTLCNDNGTYLLPDTVSDGSDGYAINPYGMPTTYNWGYSLPSGSDGTSLTANQVSTLMDATGGYVLTPAGDTAFVINAVIVRKQPQICLVTGTIDGNMQIIADVGSLTDTASVWRTGDNQSTYVGSLDTALNVVTDSTYNTAQLWQYHVETSGCPASSSHQPIHLRNSGGLLEWYDYAIDEDTDPTITNLTGYVVAQLDTVNNVLDTVGNVSIGGDFYDATVANPNHYYGAEYRLLAVREPGCDIAGGSGKRDAGMMVLSNPVALNTGVGIERLATFSTTMINPSDGIHLTIDKNVDVSVFTLHGQLIETYINTNRVDEYLPTGMYLVVLETEGARTTKKLVVR